MILLFFFFSFFEHVVVSFLELTSQLRQMALILWSLFSSFSSGILMGRALDCVLEMGHPSLGSSHNTQYRPGYLSEHQLPL